MATAEALERARRAVAQAEAVLICAGAGMSADSGLPTFYTSHNTKPIRPASTTQPRSGRRREHAPITASHSHATASAADDGLHTHGTDARLQKSSEDTETSVGSTREEEGCAPQLSGLSATQSAKVAGKGDEAQAPLSEDTMAKDRDAPANRDNDVFPADKRSDESMERNCATGSHDSSATHSSELDSKRDTTDEPPPFAALPYTLLASRRLLADAPERAWAWYAQTARACAAAAPHAGYARLLDFVRALPGGYRVMTSNVDGLFARAGFSGVTEVHGSLARLQCATHGPLHGLWPAASSLQKLEMEAGNGSVVPATLPRCRAQRVARPNMLLFGDPDWHDVRAERQTAECHTWLNDCAAARQRLVIFEIGAGDTVPTIRLECERAAMDHMARGDEVTIVRINPGETKPPALPGAHVCLSLSARDALEALLTPAADASADNDSGPPAKRPLLQSSDRDPSPSSLGLPLSLEAQPQQ